MFKKKTHKYQSFIWYISNSTQDDLYKIIDSAVIWCYDPGALAANCI